MPIQVKVVNPEHKNQNLFQCLLNSKPKKHKCKRCIFTKANGERCKLRTCFEINYCWIHLQKTFDVRIAPSKIQVDGHSIGLGLFARSTKPIPPNVRRRITSRTTTPDDKLKYRVFKAKQKIGKYTGEVITQDKLNARYDYKNNTGQIQEQVAPYAVTNSHHQIIDALCRRNFLAYANDARASGLNYNAKMSKRNMILQAQKDIYQGDEILWNYGEDYWADDVSTAEIKQKRVR